MSTPRNGMPAPWRRARPATRSSATRFLKALEDSQSVGRRTGWQPQYLLAETDDGTLLRRRAALPQGPSARANTSSTTAGHRPSSAPAAATIPSSRPPSRSRRSPARACSRGPGRYADAVRRRADRHAGQDRRRQRISSVHVTFCTEADWKRFGAHGWLLRARPPVSLAQRRLWQLRRFPGRARLAQAQGDPQGTRGGAPRGPDHQRR